MIRSRAPLPRSRSTERRGPMRDPDYLAWLRERRCIACRSHVGTVYGFSAVIDPAHGPVNGMRSKGADNEAIPLCRHHHQEQHLMGWTAFQVQYGFSREREAQAHYSTFLIDRENER